MTTNGTFIVFNFCVAMLYFMGQVHKTQNKIYWKFVQFQVGTRQLFLVLTSFEKQPQKVKTLESFKAGSTCIP